MVVINVESVFLSCFAPCADFTPHSNFLKNKIEVTHTGLYQFFPTFQYITNHSNYENNNSNRRFLKSLKIENNNLIIIRKRAFCFINYCNC